MNSPSSHQDLPKSSPEEDPVPPYTQSAADISSQVDPHLPEGWIRQWHAIQQSYFYINTRTNPPFTTWLHPLDEIQHQQIHTISSSSDSTQSWPYLPSTSEPSSEFDWPRVPSCKDAEHLQCQVAAYQADVSSATPPSSKGGSHRNVGVLGQREFHPEPAVSPTTGGGTSQSNLPLRARLMMNTPISLHFFRREPKWVRRVEKLVDRLQKKEDKLGRRMDKLAGKCERRLLQAQHTKARNNHLLPGPSRMQ